MQKYQPKEFESKWREVWKREKIFNFQFSPHLPTQSGLAGQAKKYYVLVELPYTSGDLHVGHWFSFAIPDILARFKRMSGFNVFYPIGYDAFGLPAENAAIKHGVHPKDWTMKNVENMTRQFQTMGTMLNNWEEVVITCLPEYYKWNQWIFLKMYERGLAYRGMALSNWCPSCQTVLANENIENGKCWRCGTVVIQKQVEQWFLRITKYANRLLWKKNENSELGNPEGSQKANGVDWPKQVQIGQNNWIGRKEGINITYKIKDSNETITCFTTTPVNFGATFLVVAPEHPFVTKILNKKLKVGEKTLNEIKKYVEKAKHETEEERKIAEKDKTGIFTGFYAINQLTGKPIPIWISDFVLMSVGTGAVQGCPGHDYRDFDFAKKFGIPIPRVVTGPKGETDPIEKKEDVVEHGGVMVNSDFLNGIPFKKAMQMTMDYFEKKGWGKRVVTYHLRDWSVSRQRYWGPPIPIIYCDTCWEVKSQKSKVKSLRSGVDYTIVEGKEYMIHPVPLENLPVELPYEVDFTPKGKPPLATNKKWLNVKCPRCGSEAKRDAETLDTFFDSAWYWYRYVSPNYTEAPFDKSNVKELTPVDVYFGGAEHTLGHTLYARFFTKFFKDLGLVDYEEFALKRIQHGVVLGPDGARMSKSKGNVINPDDVVAEYGSDTVRMYLCFMMPYEATGPWSDKTIAGVHRFLNRVWKIFQGYKDSATQFLSHESIIARRARGPLESEKNAIASSFNESPQLVSKLQKTIRKVTADIEKIKMNTAIAAMMEFLKEWESRYNMKYETLSIENAKKFLQILAPFAPYMTEEIWRNFFGEKKSIHLSKWTATGREISEELVNLPVQVNGKLREMLKVTSEKLEDQKYIESKAMESEKIKKYLAGKKFKVIYVKGKILNLVVN